MSWPTESVSIVVVPIFERAGQVGTTDGVVSSNWASVQPVSVPALSIDGLSVVPGGSVTVTAPRADWAGVDGKEMLVVNAPAPPALAGAALKATDGLKATEPQLPMVTLLLELAVLVAPE